MLTIIEIINRWWYYFKDLRYKIIIITDHKNLLWFTETKMYNRHQAWWTEKMSRFDFVIIFQSRKLDEKPDTLSRWLNYIQEDANILSQEIIFLHLNQIDIFLLDQNISETNILLFTFNETMIQFINLDIDLIQSIKDALFNDWNIDLYLKFLKNIILSHDEDVKLYLELFSLHDHELILHNKLIYILNNLKLKLRIL